MKPFRIKDCALAVRMADVRQAMNLRELYDRLAVCSVDSLYHHFCETTLRPSFDDPEFRNDFAVWAYYTLKDEVLAEQLGVLNPYDYKDLEDLRRVVLEVIDERLSRLTYFPWARQGQAFEFLQAHTVVFDTGKSIDAPEDLPLMIGQMTTSSLYYHFLEARRRVDEHRDDFTAWLLDWNSRGEQLIKAFSEVDFYFLSLKELQKELLELSSRIMRKVLAQ